ncbi:disease resistance protein PIK5-NP-like [Lolium rigidum]|uniref:disease resistance protein PIK5-NP-like n=1 Tax=Lolium rigidum TaxID=89674 RepID=UPI001F5CE7C0|nr:disease resistance protein PIK5-NP-like [Lolium rigidum]
MEKSPVTAATGALGPVIAKLAALLGREYKLRWRTRRDIKFIKSKLKSVHSLLWTICERELLDAASKELKMEALDLADDMEDAIDDFIVSMERSRSSKPFVQTKGKASPLQDFKKRVTAVSERCSGMWKKISSSPSRPTPRARPFVRKEASELVPMDRQMDVLIRVLVGTEDSILVEPKLKMASILGTAGMGKTTLADLIYQAIGNRFQARAFVSVTPGGNITEVLARILEEVADENTAPFPDTEAAFSIKDP